MSFYRYFCSLVCLCLLFGLSVVAARAAQQEPFGQLFGRQAFPAGARDIPAYIERQWTRVVQAEQKNPCLRRDGSCMQPADASHWLYLAGKASAMDEMTLLRAVSAFFNKFSSVSDMENYGVKDRWPTMADFADRRSGDCKAYTLSKYFALRAFGVKDEDMRIVLVYLPERRMNHSVLAVNTSRGVFILDNNTRPIDLILPLEKVSANFVPLFMVNEKGRWTFRQDPKLLRVR